MKTAIRMPRFPQMKKLQSVCNFIYFNAIENGFNRIVKISVHML